MRFFSRLLSVAALGACLALSGCIYMASSSISSSNKTQAGNTATASAEDWGFLHLVAPQGLTGVANQQLVNSCPSGKFTDVQTELAVRDFIGIAQQYMITATAICQ
jgi:hypothetical protein